MLFPFTGLSFLVAFVGNSVLPLFDLSVLHLRGRASAPLVHGVLLLLHWELLNVVLQPVVLQLLLEPVVLLPLDPVLVQLLVQRLGRLVYV